MNFLSTKGKIRIIHYLSAIVPLLIVILFLGLTVILGIIPVIESYTIRNKKNQTIELVRSVWSIADGVHNQYKEGILDEQEAQSIVCSHVINLRYGIEMKDYCWIHDMDSNIVAHPYQDKKDLSDHSDPSGFKVVPQMNSLVDELGEGFIDYQWQWKDDPSRTEKKTSFVKSFEPWNWVIGSGFYENEILDEIREVTQPIVRNALLGLVLVSCLLFIPLRMSFRFIHDLIEKDTEINKLSGIVRDAPLSIVVTDLKGNIEYANPQVVSKYGWSEEELNQGNVRLFKSGLVSNETYNSLWNTILSGETWKGELINKNKWGELIWEELLVAPIRDDDQKITHFYGIKHDISQQKKLQNNLLVAKSQAEESSRLKSIFLNNFSHEIRTPLNAIFGFSDLLKQEAQLSNEGKEAIVTIERNSSILLKIVDQILKVSELESNAKLDASDELELNEFLTQIVKKSISNSPHPLQENVEIQTDYNLSCENGLVVITNRHALEEIIENLLLNAIKFTESGYITIGYRLDSSNDISIYIKDTGCGISISDQPHVLKKFFQGKSKFFSLHEGAGLGLSIVNKLTLVLGGKISFKSQQDFGTEFSVTGVCRPKNEQDLAVSE